MVVAERGLPDQEQNEKFAPVNDPEDARFGKMKSDEVIGIVPCGGLGSRIAPAPCSKEIFPVGIWKAADGSPRPKVVSHYLLEKFRYGGVRKTIFILRKGKWDIPEYYGDGSYFDINIAYLVALLPYGPPYTVDQAYPFVRHANIAFGFPDILLDPPDAYKRALQRLAATRSDLVLGLYRSRDILHSDMIAVDRQGRVREIELRPSKTKRTIGWMFAVWTPTFTEFLHEYLKTPRTNAQLPGAQLPMELTMGHIIQAALSEDIVVQSVRFYRHHYLDIGTADGLRQISADLWVPS